VRRPAANVVLCLLVLVGSTSLSVRHAHAHGGSPHAHGYGPAAVCPPAGPTDGGDGRHEHILFCGVEVYHHDCPDCPADDSAPGSDSAPPQVTVGFGDACDHRADAGAVEAADGLLAVAFVQPIFTPPPTARVEGRPTSVRPVCDSARGARTGVLTV
jgi:hypothetical protein